MSRKPKSIRFSKDEWEQLAKMAESASMTRAEFIRQASLSGLHGQRGRQARSSVIAEVGAIGGVLSEMRRTHEQENSNVLDVAEIERLLEKDRKALEELGAFKKVEEETSEEEDFSLQEPPPTPKANRNR